MPTDANTFNNPSIEVLLTHVNGCNMTQVALSAIKLEDILNPSYLGDLDEEDIVNTFTNMRNPSPTVAAGVSIPVQGINIYTKSQKCLIIAS